MLSPEENELLTRVGPGTPMGALLRQYWIPALRSERLKAGGAPAGVRLLGENFVAFRASDGRVGFFDEACPHRGASLVLARNEDCALRCLFHGWKIDVTGKVVEIPSEPPEQRERLAAKIRVRHYPVVESGEVVWGPERLRPGIYSSSPVLADDRIYVTNEDGVTSIVALAPPLG